MNVTSEIMLSVSNSVMLTRYSVIMPFCVSGGGGSHEMKRDVELSDTTVTFSGELDGAEVKDKERNHINLLSDSK